MMLVPYTCRHKVLAQAVVAYLFMAASLAWAGTGSCPNAGSNTISTAVTIVCGLAAGDSLSVSAPVGSIVVADAAVGAVAITGINGSTSVTNAGDISNTLGSGITLASSTEMGDILNDTGGTIYGATGEITGGSAGIRVNGSVDLFSTIGSISNNGIIKGQTGILINGGGNIITGGIVNDVDGIIEGTAGTAINLSGLGAPTVIDNYGELKGAVLLNDSTLNIFGNAIITGKITGNEDSVVNLKPDAAFTTNSAIDVGAFTIASSGVLYMDHDVAVASVAGLTNDGTLVVAAGNNVTLTGDYVQGATGLFDVGASSDANYGQLRVTGSADLPDSVWIDVSVDSVNTLAADNVLADVLTAGTLNATTFSVYDNSYKLGWQFAASSDVAASSDATTVDLTAKPTGMTTLANVASSAGANSVTGVAGSLDGILDKVVPGTMPTDEMTTLLYQLTNLNSSADVLSVIQQLTPVLEGAAAQSSAGILGGGASTVVHEQMRDTVGLSSGDVMRSESAGWIRPYGSWAKQSDRNGVPGYKANTRGLVLGKDGKSSEDWRIGAALSFGGSKVRSSSGTQSVEMKTRQATVYAINRMDETTALYLQFGLGFNNNDSRRDVLGDVAVANYSSIYTQSSAEIERVYNPNGNTVFTPSLGIEHTYINVKGYSESGAGMLNLTVDGQTQNALLLHAGGKVGHRWNDEARLTAHLNLGYDVLAKQATVTSSFSNFSGSTFVTDGIKPSSTIIRTGVGYEIEKVDGTEIVTRYDLEKRSGYTNKMLSLNYRVLF